MLCVSEGEPRILAFPALFAARKLADDLGSTSQTHLTRLSEKIGRKSGMGATMESSLLLRRTAKAAASGGSRGTRWNSWGRSGIGAGTWSRCTKEKVLAVM